MAQKSNDKTTSIPFLGRVTEYIYLNWVKGYIYLTATALAVVGFFLLSTWWATRSSHDWWLGWQDPLLKISDRAMLIITGLLHLGVAAYLFGGRSLVFRSLAILWTGLIVATYYAGIHFKYPLALLNTERFIGWRLQLHPEVVDSRWRTFQLYLIATGVLLIILFRPRLKQIKEAWLKQRKKIYKMVGWALRRNSSISKIQPAILEVKFSCTNPACQQHIMLDESRFGRQIQCPACGTILEVPTFPAKS